jgi:hypothetical protein
MMGRCLIPNTGYDLSWTQLGRGAFNERPLPSQGVRQFVNKLRMTNSVPIGSTTAVTAALVGTNEQRALLVLQNNSTATVAGDTAPTFFFGFGAQPQVGYSLALPPGVGIVLDVRVPSDAIYVAFGPFVNAGGSTKIQGVCAEGGVTDPVGDTVNMTDSGQIGQLVQLLKQLVLAR